jgi:prevent-host-death family protein
MTIKECDMEHKVIPVAEAKTHLSEYLTISYKEGIRIVITKRGKPFAALVSIKDLKNLEQADEKKGLAEIAGKWDHFNEISQAIEEVYNNRKKDQQRHVSF